MQKSHLFLASCLSLTTCGALFAIRSNIATELGTHFAADQALIGKVLGQGFFGMGYVIAIASPLCDFLGMKRLLILAFLLHIAGMIGFLFAPGTATDPQLHWAQYSMLCVGLAHGLVEGVINPLIATLYPDQKTHKLNVLHAWWPGGIILGGLAAWFLRAQGFSWQVQWSVGFLPTVVYGLVALTAQFPKTERAASGVSAATMVGACLHPMFLVFFAMMALTAATELGTGQWLDAVLTKTAGFEGILLLVYGSGLMFVLRFFAGPFAHRLSPVGLLTVSAALAAVGLWLLSIAASGGVAIAAATVFFIGVCYFWPTMLGVVSERHPKTGALGMGLLAASGFLGSGYITERMGAVYKDQGAAAAFQFAAWLPVVLTGVFLLVWLWIRARGGYRVEVLQGGEPAK
ncbi:MAG: MFS transporter [Planctomycetota bacterium]